MKKNRKKSKINRKERGLRTAAPTPALSGILQKRPVFLRGIGKKIRRRPVYRRARLPSAT